MVVVDSAPSSVASQVSSTSLKLPSLLCEGSAILIRDTFPMNI
jgi:hypothetical protein